jgi:hypothetical protein
LIALPNLSYVDKDSVYRSFFLSRNLVFILFAIGRLTVSWLSYIPAIDGTHPMAAYGYIESFPGLSVIEKSFAQLGSSLIISGYTLIDENLSATDTIRLWNSLDTPGLLRLGLIGSLSVAEFLQIGLGVSSRNFIPLGSPL